MSAADVVSRPVFNEILHLIFKFDRVEHSKIEKTIELSERRPMCHVEMKLFLTFVNLPFNIY